MFSALGKREAAECSEVVSAVLGAARLKRAVSVFALAHGCGLKLTPQVGRAEGLVGDEIRYDLRSSREWQEACVASALAQWALRWCGVRATGSAVRFVARAFLHAQPTRISAPLLAALLLL